MRRTSGGRFIRVRAMIRLLDRDIFKEGGGPIRLDERIGLSGDSQT